MAIDADAAVEPHAVIAPQLRQVESPHENHGVLAPQSLQVEPPNSRAKRKAHDIQVRFNEGSVEGGRSKDKTVVDTIEFSNPDNTVERFARVTKKSNWFWKCLVQSEDRGRLRFLNVLDDISSKLDAEYDTEVADSSAAVAAGEEADDVDPMDALAEVEDDSSNKKPRKKKKKSGVSTI